MILMLHIVIALASVAVAGLAFVRPSRKLLFASYSLIALTLGSGLYLVAAAPAHMLESCLMGMAYVTIVSAATVATRGRLALSESRATENA